MNTDEVVFPPCAISTYNLHIPDEGPKGVSGLVPNKRKETSVSRELYSLNGRNKVMSTAKWSCQSLS